MTIQDLAAAMPAAERNGRLVDFGAALLASMAQGGILETNLRAAHFLAQVGHESGDLWYKEELASGAAYEGRAALGNSEPGDGERFKGRGFLQLTGRANYARYGAATGRDLVSDPGQVATDPELCVGVATWFWNGHGLNALADADDAERITRRINGGLNGYPDRLARLAQAKRALGVIS